MNKIVYAFLYAVALLIIALLFYGFVQHGDSWLGAIFCLLLLVAVTVVFSTTWTTHNVSSNIPVERYHDDGPPY